MPLKSGSGPKVRSSNIAELMRAFNESGRIGNSKPASKKAAVRQAAAIAYRKARDTIAGRG